MSYIAKNLVKVLAGAVIIGAGYTAMKPNDGFLHQMKSESDIVNATVDAKDLKPYKIIVREGDSIGRYQLNCAPKTGPLGYRNAFQELNDLDSAGIQKGATLDVLIDQDNANEWCEQRVIDQNRHLNQ